MECLNKMDKLFELIEESDVEKLKDFLQNEKEDLKNGGNNYFLF